MPVVVQPALTVVVLPRKPDVHAPDGVRRHAPVERRIGRSPYGAARRVRHHLRPPEVVVVAGVELLKHAEPLLGRLNNHQLGSSMVAMRKQKARDDCFLSMAALHQQYSLSSRSSR